MKELLEQSGWYMYKKCRCGGTLKQKFKNVNKAGAEVWVYPNRNTWEYKISRRINNSNIGIDTLRDFLEAL